MLENLILYVCYNDKSKELPQQIQDKYPELKVISYDENHYAEKKKAYKIKGGYSARMTPFMLLLGEDKSYKKAFYSEDNSCTLANLEQWLTSM